MHAAQGITPCGCTTATSTPSSADRQVYHNVHGACVDVYGTVLAGADTRVGRQCALIRVRRAIRSVTIPSIARDSYGCLPRSKSISINTRWTTTPSTLALLPVYDAICMKMYGIIAARGCAFRLIQSRGVRPLSALRSGSGCWAKARSDGCSWHAKRSRVADLCA